MVSPINGDKPLSVSTDRSGESARNARSEQPAVTSANAPERASSRPAETLLEVEGARQLYDLEHQPPRSLGTGISSPEEARSLLNQVLGQISARPEDTLKAQGAQAAPPLANLLKTMPG